MAYRVVFVAALVGLASLGVVASCEDDRCAGVSCGSGVVVWWSPGDVAVAASYRLCINGGCEFVEPVPGGTGDYLRVAPVAAGAEDDVVVDLELLDDQGARVAAFRGVGHKTGRCCPGVEFRVTADGELTVDSV